MQYKKKTSQSESVKSQEFFVFLLLARSWTEPLLISQEVQQALYDSHLPQQERAECKRNHCIATRNAKRHFHKVIRETICIILHNTCMFIYLWVCVRNAVRRRTTHNSDFYINTSTLKSTLCLLLYIDWLWLSQMTHVPFLKKKK